MRKRGKNVLRYRERCCVWMNKIVIYTDKINGKLDNNTIDEFIYDSFTMIVTKNEHSDIAMIFDIATNNGNPNDCCCRVTMFNEITGEYEIVTEFGWIITNDKIETRYKNESDNDTFGDVSCDWADYLYAVMAYIMTSKRERVQKKNQSRSFENNSKEHAKEYKPRNIYLLDEIVDYVNENGLTIQSRGTHKINCPCWSVRGHYRHYKSGKVVFIKNYEKGKEKGKINPKDKFYGV